MTLCIHAHLVPFLFPRRSTSLALIVGSSLALTVHAEDTMRFQEGVSPSSDYHHATVEMRQGAPSNQRLGPMLRVGFQPQEGTQKMRSIFVFPLYDLPHNAVVEETKLVLHPLSITRRIEDLQLYRLSSDNDVLEREASWEGPSKGILWQTPGGDFEEPALSKMPGFDQATPGDVVDFPSTEKFVAAAQDALNSGKPLALLIRSADSEQSRGAQYVRFASNRYEENLQWRPELVIRYRQNK